MVGQSKGGGAVAEDSHEASSQRAAPLHRGKAALRPSGERDGNPGQKAGQKSGTENGDVGGECGGQIGVGAGGGGEKERETYVVLSAQNVELFHEHLVDAHEDSV